MFVMTRILLFALFNVVVCSGNIHGKREGKISDQDWESLEREHRNSICCEKKMRCCVRPKPPPIEIRALLARCPNIGEEQGSSISRLMPKPVIAANEHTLKTFQGFDEDEPLLQSRVMACRRKVLMTVKMHHKGTINGKAQFIVIDHVYDPVTERSVRLLNPYVIKLRQEPVSESFHLKFVDYVNSEAFEKIYNKHDGNYTGCYTDRTRSTCGTVKYDGKVVPYSGGFCCSCDAAKNYERQPDSINSKNEAIISYSDPTYLLDRIQCPRNFYDDEGGSDETTHKSMASPDVRPSTSCTRTSAQSSVQNSSSSLGESNTSSSYLHQDSKFKKDSNLLLPFSTSTPHAVPSSTQPQQITPSSYAYKRWQYTTYGHNKAMNDGPGALGSHTYLKPETINVVKNKRRDLNIAAVDGDVGDTYLKQQMGDYLKKLHNKDKLKNQKNYMKNLKKTHPQDQGDAYLRAIDERFGGDVFAERLMRKARQTFPSGVQKRGGQNCADRYTPPGMNPDTYHESTHCLRFSDVWYGIYKLGDPFIEQSVWINIYERFETETTSEKWREITNGTVYLGNRNPLYEDETPTISIKFTTQTFKDQRNTKKYDALHTKRILIPEGIKACDLYKYPEIKNGPEEYLVVKPEQVAIEGDQCDRIGIGFEAFYKQPQRCSVPRSTCLHNQPKHLWRHDKAVEKRNKRGCYFLKYHANITNQPIIVNKTSGEKYLDVEYTGIHVTNVDIEIKADFNAVIRQQTSAAITEVYVDSTCEKITILTIKVINTGLVSNRFMVHLSDFPLEFPALFNRIQSKVTLISPQNQQIFTLEIRTPLPTDLVFCTVEVMNPNHELVALRRVRLQKFDRCICTWHCLCACVASSVGLKCNPMSLEQYHAAGFQGSLPIVTYMMHFTLLDDLVSVVFYFALFLLAVLLLMGLVKAVLGFCCFGIGMWGLTVLLDLPKRLKRYYEPHLRKHQVVYDSQGWAIHPITKKRARNISVSTEFCTNMVFFFTYPLAGCLIILRRLCCPYYVKRSRKHETCDNSPTPSPKVNRADQKGGCGKVKPRHKKSRNEDMTTEMSDTSRHEKTQSPSTCEEDTYKTGYSAAKEKKAPKAEGKKKKNILTCCSSTKSKSPDTKSTHDTSPDTSPGRKKKPKEKRSVECPGEATKKKKGKETPPDKEPVKCDVNKATKKCEAAKNKICKCEHPKPRKSALSGSEPKASSEMSTFSTAASTKESGRKDSKKKLPKKETTKTSFAKQIDSRPSRSPSTTGRSSKSSISPKSTEQTTGTTASTDSRLGGTSSATDTKQLPALSAFFDEAGSRPCHPCDGPQRKSKRSERGQPPRTSNRPKSM